MRPPDSNAPSFGASQQQVPSTDSPRKMDATTQLAAILQASVDAIVSMTPDGVLCLWSPGTNDMLGYSSDEIFGIPLKRLFAEEDQTALTILLERVLTGERIPPWQATAIRKDGHRFEASVTFAPLQQSQQIVGITAIIRDISELKGSVRASQVSEKRFQALFETNTIGILFVNGEQVLDANTVFLQMLGYTRDEFTSRRLSWADLTPPEHVERDRQAIDELLASGRCAPYEKEYLRKDGSRVPVLVSASIIDTNPPLGAGFVIDLTLQKQAQQSARRLEETLRQRLEENRNQLRLITDAAPILIGYIDPDHVFQFNNLHYSRWFNRPLEEITGKPVRSVVGDIAYEGVRDYLTTALSGTPVSFERIMPYRDSPTRHIHADFIPDRDSTGTVRGIITVVTDITATKVSQEEQLRSLTEIEALNARLRQAMTETHHRVKNNLQIIAALVGMQTLVSGETVPKADLERIGLHVRSLATVHDMLTQEAKIDGEANTLSARHVLSKLLFLLKDTFGSHRLEYILDDIRLSARQSTSLGIIVNELVSNAMKYGKEAVIVSLLQQGEEIVLQVADDGPGFPEGFTPFSNAHTGLELVENLSRWDLSGSTRYENRPNGGANVIVTFPLPAELG